MKAIFTTGEAADICKVSQQTIIRCFDSGRLKGFKVPGSKFRRIPRAALIAFMKEHHIPVDELDSGKPKLLVVGNDCACAAQVKETDYEIKSASNGYEAGLLTQEFLPDVILMGALENAAEQVAMCKAVRRHPDLQHTRIVVSCKMNEPQAAELSQAGAMIVSDGSSIDGVLQQLRMAV